MLKLMLHDWDDERSVAILKQCRRAIAPGGTLLVMEHVLPAGDEPALDAVMFDITMLVIAGGRERSEAERGGVSSPLRAGRLPADTNDHHQFTATYHRGHARVLTARERRDCTEEPSDSSTIVAAMVGDRLAPILRHPSALILLPHAF